MWANLTDVGGLDTFHTPVSFCRQAHLHTDVCVARISSALVLIYEVYSSMNKPQ